MMQRGNINHVRGATFIHRQRIRMRLATRRDAANAVSAEASEDLKEVPRPAESCGALQESPFASRVPKVKNNGRRYSMIQAGSATWV